MLAKPNPVIVGSGQELTIRQAAAMLNVSRHFVHRLIYDAQVQGVRTLRSGHQRIPLAEVERVKADLSEATRIALDSLYQLTEPVRRLQGAGDPGGLEPAASKTQCTAIDRNGTAPVSMFFGRGIDAFALAGIGVPRQLKGAKAVKVAMAAGIITPSGRLAKRYR